MQLDFKGDTEREKKEDAERWKNYQATGQAISHRRAVTWMKSLIAGKKVKIPE